MAREPLTLVSLNSGSGAMELGLEHALGATTVLQVEPWSAARGKLSERWPEVCRVALVEGSAGTAALPAGRALGVLCGRLPPRARIRSPRGFDLGPLGWQWPSFVEWMSDTAPVAIALRSTTNLLTRLAGEDFSRILCDLATAGYDASWSVVRTMARQGKYESSVVLTAVRREAPPLRFPPWSRVDPEDEHRRRDPVGAQEAEVAGLLLRARLTERVGTVGGRVLAAFVGGRRRARQEKLFDNDTPPCPRWPKTGVMHLGVVRRADPAGLLGVENGEASRGA